MNRPKIEYALKHSTLGIVTTWVTRLAEIRRWRREFYRDVPGWAGELVIVKREHTFTDTEIE